MITTRSTKSFTGTALLAASLGLAALLSDGTAGAVASSDSGFLADLQQNGITGDSNAEVSLGHTVCQALEAGESPQNVVNEVAHVTSLSPQGANRFALISAQAYCPQYVRQA